MSLPNLPFTLTAQHALNGLYDLEWMKMKAQHDLSKSMINVTTFHYCAMDFSISIASLADWAFALQGIQNPSWSSLRPRDGLAEFTKYIATQSDAVAAFSDLANEYKHANRTKGSRVLTKVTVHFGDSQEILSKNPEWLKNAINPRSSSGLVFVPFVEVNGGALYFYKELAEEALKWWASFDPISVTP